MMSVKILYPVYFILSEEDETIYNSMDEQHQKEFLLTKSGYYLENNSISPVIESIQIIEDSKK